GSSVKSQIDSTNKALAKVLGDDITFCVRPPYGSYNKTALAAFGAPGVGWSVDSNDWRWTNNADKTVSEIMSSADDGAIILLHDTHSWSVKAALTVIDRLQAEGYEFVTVSELFRRRGESMKAGTMYFSRKPAATQLDAITVPVPELIEADGKKYVSLQSDAGAVIRYEYGDKVPTPASAVYTAPLPFEEGGMLISAVAFIDNNGSRSDLARIYINEKGNCFADVTPDDWYYESIDYFVSEGITNGVGNNYMDPNGSLSRAMLVTMLYRLAGGPEVKTPAEFTDVAEGLWYSDSVAWAAEQGIVTGFPDGSFKPDQNVSREDLACIVYRSDKNAEGARLTDENRLFEYSDYKQIYAYAAEAVRWALDHDLLVTDPGQIKPKADATRAVTLEMLYRQIKP
ncbi:MAG: S-layer homology domain-containing protein, partial [Firmicutes bacterium]|nr:S-layer homology domain-containing protein [Bacillota bacterium]